MLVVGLAACGEGGDGDFGRPADLPLPSQVSRREYQERLYAFLGELRYRRLGWKRDKRVRDTGPYRDGTYYGTHPAVRVYYSPEVMAWLVGGRQGRLPDGAMLVKEMYPPPAVRWAGRRLPMPTWTVMTRDAAGAVDGWFWTYFDSNPSGADPPVPQPPDDLLSFRYPDSDFGSYCVRCHASAESEMTFASLENIDGYAGQPIRYEVDESWRGAADPGGDPHPNGPPPLATPAAEPFVNDDWLALFDQIPRLARAQVEPLPPVSADRVPADGRVAFVTADQCKPCHAGDVSPFGPNMVVDGADLSPFGEWRWSMMGLAGRDPIFYAQLESEVARHGGRGAFAAADIENLCLHCHGVMGQRQFVDDHPDQPFTVAAAMAHAEGDARRDYGGLARDGVSCMACHRATDDADLALEQIINGDFRVDPPRDGVIDVYGPFASPSEYAMRGALGVRPREGVHLRGSRLCASCHTVFLPVLDGQGRVVDGRFEQATFLEWMNSDYRDDGAAARSCQDCHMPETFAGRRLAFKIANIQDQDFPPTSFLAPLADITVEPRDGYRRHSLAGINVFALELFRQFPDVLGVRTRSFMTGFDDGLARAIANAAAFAARDTATVEILAAEREGGTVTAQVRVTNRTGHRLPSGVGFRRLVLELTVLDGGGAVRWASGRMNALGVVVDGDGVPLPAELHDRDPGTNAEVYEPHYQAIDRQDQAQIYEELVRDTDGNFTTSFLARAEDVKDNRLLPHGWTPHGPPGFDPEHAEATWPHGGAAGDADFTDGGGSDTITYRAHVPDAAAARLVVRAALYYQAIPPRYLADRFDLVGGAATRRLHFLTSHLDDRQTPFAGWKLPLAAAARDLP